MSGFGQYQQQAIKPEWSDHYVNYESLKSKLSAFRKRKKTLLNILDNGGNITEGDLYLVTKANELDVKVVKEVNYNMRKRGKSKDYERDTDSESNSDDDEENKKKYHRFIEGKEKLNHILETKSVLHRISLMERFEYCVAVEKEVSKAAKFYSSVLPKILASLENIKKKDDAEKALYLKVVGDDVLELLAFVVVNIITLRQSLIRYDGYVKTSNGLGLSHWYLTKMSNCTEDALLGLFHLDVLFDVKTTLLEYSDTKGTEMFLKDFILFQSLLDKTFHSVQKAAKGYISFRERWIARLRHLLELGSVSRILVYQPSFLRIRGKDLKKELEVVTKWRQEKKMPSDEVTIKPEIDAENVYPLVLNLVSCFLYMMGGYIVEPSSAYYVNALGSSDALAGMVIGAMPWAALFSAVVYSFWTNHSYKQPIICASIMSIIGHLLYASAFKYNSIIMCLSGRVIVGLGAPRIINRRYIADTTPFAIRTAATSAFGMATALGAALGPGTAVLLDFLNIETDLPLFGKFYLNGMTGPGYVMTIAWFMYLLLIVFTFKEPVRSGLDELKKREAENLLSDCDECTVASDFSSSTCSTMLQPQDKQPNIPCQSQKNTSFARKITPPVYICMLLVFLKRMVLECVVASTSIVTKNRYGWTPKHVGALHFLNGCLIIPLCMLAGYLSLSFEDRYLCLWCMSFTLVGVSSLIDFTDFSPSSVDVGYNDNNPWSVSPTRYIIGSIIAFSAVEVNESFLASLLSKLVPSALATGTLNSGLLLTLVGTGGRAVGDLFLTAMGYISLRYLLNLVMIPAAFFVIASILIVRTKYNILYEI